MKYDDARATESCSDGHIPVLLEDVVEQLKGGREIGGKIIVDGTFGGGGYSRALLNAGAKVVGVDRDPDAVARGEVLMQQHDSFKIVKATFSEIDDVVEAQGLSKVDGVVLDIGVSSYQLDEGERGFSWRNDGPLDMRMSSEGLSAADILALSREAELADIFYYYGEERKSRVIARKICERRKKNPLKTTADLLAVIEEVYPRKRQGKHPAARIFQALRIAVNKELEELEQVLPKAAELLAENGRLVVVSFHSLEDRIVKTFMREKAQEEGFAVIFKRPLVPSDEECERNPRARSAKLRVLERRAV